MPSTHTFTAPLNGASRASLELVRPGGRVAIVAGGTGALCRGRFHGLAPVASVDGGRVTIRYPRLSLAGWLRAGERSAELELAPGLPWAITIDGGLGHATLELSELALERLEVGGGAESVLLVLPRPRGIVRVRIAGGASNVEVVRPAGVAAALRIAGGATRLAFDGERYGSIGGETRLETPFAADDPDRYELEVLGGASRLVVGGYEEGERR